MLDWLRRALKTSAPEPDAETLYRLGEAAIERRDHEQAEAFFRRAVAKDGGVARYSFALGCALQACGRLDDAVAYYRQALALDSGLVPAMINLGVLLQASTAGVPGAQAK